MIAFGDKVTDSITGFTGTAIERVECIDGGIFWGVQPRADMGEGLVPDVEYFSEERLMFSLKELRAMKNGEAVK